MTKTAEEAPLPREPGQLRTGSGSLLQKAHPFRAEAVNPGAGTGGVRWKAARKNPAGREVIVFREAASGQGVWNTNPGEAQTSAI